MADRIRFEDFMSDSDASLWLGERDPRMRSTILSIWILDRMPDEDDFEEMLVESVEAIPRLRQRVVQDSYEIAPPRWELDPDFDPRFHLRRLHLGGEGTLRDLLDLAEPIAMQAFDKDRPLWELYLVEGLERGRAGVIMKLHHAVSDGVGLVQMTDSMVETERGARGATRRVRRHLEDLPRPDPIRERQRVRDAIEHRIDTGRSRAQRFFAGVGELLADFARAPTRTLGRAWEMLGSIGHLLEPAQEPMSPLMRKRSTSRSLSAFCVPFADLKRASRAAGASINDVFVAAVAGGLRAYHAHFDTPVDELRMMMPINLRGDDEKGSRAGNQFAPARLLVPVGIEEPRARIEAIRNRVLDQRDEAALPYVEDILSVLNRLPTSVMDQLMEGILTAVDFVTSNVPGPRDTTYTSGAKIEHMYPFGPPAGAAMNITLFSYGGHCHIGVNSDRAAVEDPELLLECLKKGFDEVVAIADETPTMRNDSGAPPGQPATSR
jgi:WS/DGAT/MGAT family acyltransferase